MILNWRLIKDGDSVSRYAGCVNDLCKIAAEYLACEDVEEIERWADKHSKIGDIFEIRDVVVEVVDLEAVMDANEMLDLLSKLPEERLNAVISNLGDKEKQIVLKAVGAHKLMNDPTFYNAVKAAVASELWKRLNEEPEKEVVEVENMVVLDKDDCMLDEEVAAGYKCLRFHCPICKRWIANAIAQKKSDGYAIIRSMCSSSFIDIEKPCRDCEGKREEVEVCPHCDTEVTVMWDVEKQGYRATCPNCGEELMLCDACMNSEDNEGMHCDWSEAGGCFRHPKEKVE